MPTIKYKDGSTWKTLDLFSGGTGVVYITGEPGAKVSWSNESKDDTGNVTLNAAGTATAMTNKNEVYTFVDETNGLVLDKEITSYNKVDLSGVTHTLEIPLGSNSYSNTVRYTGDTASKTAGWANWKDDPLFQGIKVCLLNQDGTVNYYLDRDNYTKSVDGKVSNPDLTGKDGNVMVEFPIMGWKVEKSGSALSVAITTKRNQPGFCYKAHSLNNEGDCSKIYVGVYLSSSSYNSSNQVMMNSISDRQLYNLNATTALTWTNNMGNPGYQPYQYYTHILMQILYLFVFKDTNCQNTVGQGFCYGTPSPNIDYNDAVSGKTNTVPFFGSVNSNGRSHIKCLGIENLWGLCEVPLLGSACGPNCGLKADYKNLNDPTNYRYSCVLSTNMSNGFIANVYGTNDFPFTPITVNASETTGFCDYGYTGAGVSDWATSIFNTGGKWNTRVNGSLQEYGIFYFYPTLRSRTAGFTEIFGGRLIFKKLGSWAS